jgi:hypothetical protein
MERTRQLDQRTQNGANGRMILNENGTIDDLFAVKKLVACLTLNVDNGGGAPEALYLDAWRFAQRISVYLANGKALASSIPVGLVDAIQALNFKADAAATPLENAPQVNNATGQTVQVFVEFPMAWKHTERERDHWRSLSSLGTVALDFADTGYNTNITVNTINVRLYAVGERVNKVLIPPALHLAYFSPSGQTTDQFSIMGHRVLSFLAVTTDPTNEPITDIEGPSVYLDSELVTDGRQTLNFNELQAVRGEDRYARTSYPPFGSGENRTSFGELYSAGYLAKLSELPPVKNVRVEYTAQGIPNDELYYVCASLAPLTPPEAASQVPSFRGVQPEQLARKAFRPTAGAGAVPGQLRQALPIAFDPTA